MQAALITERGGSWWERKGYCPEMTLQTTLGGSGNLCDGHPSLKKGTRPLPAKFGHGGGPQSALMTVSSAGTLT